MLPRPKNVRQTEYGSNRIGCGKESSAKGLPLPNPRKLVPVDIRQEQAYAPVVCQQEKHGLSRGEVLQGTLD